MPSGYLSADLSYSLSFQNMTKAEKRYSDPSLAFEFGYVLDDFRMDNLMITLGYYYSVYNAKKKK